MSSDKAIKALKLDHTMLRTMFVGCVVVGVVLILLVIMADLSPIIAVLLSTLLMIAYWIRFKLAGEPHGLRAIFADSIYYLGFLLTIMSLLAAMISFGYYNTELNAYAILSQFGMALVSTLVGMIIRVYYKQFEIDVESAQHSSRETLDQTMRTFNAKMNIVSVNLENLITSTDNVIANADTQTEQAKKIIEGYSTEITELNDLLLSTLVKKIDIAMTKLANTAEQTLKAIPQSAAIAREEGEAHLKLLAISLETQLSKLSTTMASTMSASFEKAGNDSKQVATHLATIREHLETLSPQFGKLADHNKASSESMSKLNDNLEKSNDTVLAMSNNILKMLQQVVAKTEAINESDRKISGQVEQLISNYSKLMEEYKQTMVKSKLADLIDNESLLLKKLNSHSSIVDDLNTHLKSHTTSLIDNTGKITKQLSETSKFIVDELSEK